MALVIRIEQKHKLILEKSLVCLAVSQYDADTVEFAQDEGPVDGWHICQILFAVKWCLAALALVTLYLDEMVEFFFLEIQCKFNVFVNSTSAISNVQKSRDLIPKRCLPTMLTFYPLWQRLIQWLSVSLLSIWRVTKMTQQKSPNFSSLLSSMLLR